MIPSLVLLLALLGAATAEGATTRTVNPGYAGPVLKNGSTAGLTQGAGTFCSGGAPCALSTAISQHVTGDTIEMNCGPNATLNNPVVYRGTTDMIEVVSKSGITIRPAVGCEGKIDVDGQFARVPVHLGSVTNTVVEGINAHSSSVETLYINGTGSNIKIYRSIFWDSPMDQNLHIIGIHGTNNDILLEDVAAFGAGRKAFQPSQGPSRVTCRRCYLEPNGTSYSGPGVGTIAYASTFIRLENVIGTISNESMPQSYTSTYTAEGTHAHGETFNNGTRDYEIDLLQSFVSHGQSGTSGTAVNASVFGSIFYGRQTLARPFAWTGNASGVAGSLQGMFFLHDLISNVTVRDVIVAFHPGNAAFSGVKAIQSSGAVNNNTITFTNVTTLGGVGNSIGTSQTKTNVVQSTATSVINGVPTIFTGSTNPWTGTTGAQVCFRYVDGAKTNTPLWPWPMQDRIKEASGYAGAYAGPCNTSCVGGRIAHRQIDVMADIQAMFGQIPTTCRVDGGVPTEPPLVTAPSTVRALVTDRPPISSPAGVASPVLSTDRPTP